MIFDDRRAAGRRLATALLPMADAAPLVLALPRGGVPVAAEIAVALAAPLDVLAVRKLGAPANPEYGVGAIAEDGSCILDTEAARHFGMTAERLQQTLDVEVAELRRRVASYRDGRPRLDVQGRLAIIVDDGLATGLTAQVAVRAVRRAGAARIVVAVPVGSAHAVHALEQEADEVVCLSTPEPLRSVGEWYGDFSPVPDEEVLRCLSWATATPRPADAAGERQVRWSIDGADLSGDLIVPPAARGLVLFAHGSGSSRHSPRNRAVAATLHEAGFATLLFDLLSEPEATRRELVFDVPLLAARLEHVARWAIDDPATGALPLAFFGASTGAAAALWAAAELGDVVQAVVSRGGRPDLAAPRLHEVTAPTLLIVGGEDHEVLELNRRAARLFRARCEIAVVRGAGHLFEGSLEVVAELAAEWFAARMPGERPLAAGAGSRS